MYKVVGADGKEYGPINLEQLKQWIAQGRVNAQTRVQEVGTAAWKTAADFPELQSPLAPPAIAPGAVPGAIGAAGTTQPRQGLAIASLICGILSLPTCLLTCLPAIICGHIAYSRARRTPREYSGSGLALAGLIIGYASIAVAFLAAPAMLLPAFARAKYRAQQINCVNNMKQIGIGLRVWALDNNDQFPFNVSTNAGGTLELSSAGPDGFDPNGPLHLMTLSNELGSTAIMVCPADTSKHPAVDFQHLRTANVSYYILSGTNITDTMPQYIVAICPIHHNALLVDGSVQTFTSARLTQTLQLQTNRNTQNVPRR